MSAYLPNTVTANITDISVDKRHRKDLGDVDALAASIAEIGLLHPVVVRPDRALIAGARRIAACKQVGWTEVPVRVVDLDEIVKGEYAENAHRKDFLPSGSGKFPYPVRPGTRSGSSPASRAARSRRLLPWSMPPRNTPGSSGT